MYVWNKCWEVSFVEFARYLFAFFLALQGELRGVRGLVPSNFLEDLSDPDDVPHHDNSNDSDVTVS